MRNTGYSLKELAFLISARLVGNPDHTIDGVQILQEAGSRDASFFANSSYGNALKKSLAGVICIDETTPVIEGKNFFISSNPSLTFQKIAQILLPPPPPSSFVGIHPSAVIADTARIDPSANIGPYVVIDAHVQIGENSSIGSHTHIGTHVQIGDECVIHPSCVIRELCQIGNRVILQPGAIIGSCGFGYATDDKGVHRKLEQLGIVVLEDDVEIGANTTIDRARFKETRIRRGTKIDNLVQIAHNVEVGSGNLIAAQTGIAGSTKTGSHVMLGGQVGVLGHIVLDDGVMAATRSGISKSLKRGKYRGSPAICVNQYNRQEIHLRRLSTYIDRLKKLEKNLEELENKLKKQ